MNSEPNAEFDLPNESGESHPLLPRSFAAFREFHCHEYP